MLRMAILVAACLAAAACGEGQGANEPAVENGASPASPAVPAKKGRDAKRTSSLLETLAAAPELSTLVNAVNAAGLTETLSGAQSYTIFAPQDAAFRKLPAGTVNDMLAPDAKGQLTALLIGHIVPGTVTAEDLARAVERGKGKAQLATMGGTTLTFTKEGEGIVVAGPKGQARIAGQEQASSNGVIHSLDTVLMP